MVPEDKTKIIKNITDSGFKLKNIEKIEGENGISLYIFSKNTA